MQPQKNLSGQLNLLCEPQKKFFEANMSEKTDNFGRSDYLRRKLPAIGVKLGERGIFEYSATKIYFFPGRPETCEKVSPYFSLSGLEKFPNLHFCGKIFSRLAIFGQQFANFRG